MARFVQMLPKSGIYADHSFMIVPKSGFNLVYLRDGKDFAIAHDARIIVHEVKFHEVERIAKEYVSTRSGGSDAADRLLGLRTAMYDSVGAAAAGKLLQVRANGSGLPTLTAKRGTAAVKLDVAILRRKEVAVAFKFVKHTTAGRALKELTKYTPAHAQDWIDKLNWIFGAQANVHFKTIGADWISLKTTASQPMTTEEFRKTLVPLKHIGAALTCFMVGKYKGSATGSDAAGSYLPTEGVCVLDDGPTYGIFDDLNYDSFIGVMAHEFGHFAGLAHHDRGRFLMSRGIETLDLDKQHVSDLNPW